MHFQQFFLSCLAQASYFIGSEGVAAVVDPQRDVELYLKEARDGGFEIKYVIETHLHADFVSGHHELAERTGAEIYLGARAGARFPHVGVRDGDEIRFGTCRLRFLETPGHTLESISVVVFDDAVSTEIPRAVLTGDTLFIGDVGRPDLGGEPRELAGMLYDSLHVKLLTLPDDVQVFPAHGAGSLCGRAMSEDRSSTIGRERATNYALKAPDKPTFVELLTSELPERPGYFARDVEINRSGAALLSELEERPLSPAEVAVAQAGGAIVLDTRDEDTFGEAHVPGAVNIGLGGQFASWAGTIVGLQVDIVIVADDEEHVRETRTRLARVGIDRAAAYLKGGMRAWTDAGMPLASIPQLDPDAFARGIEERGVQLVDVRRPAEWSAGHMPSAVHIPLNRLLSSLETLDKDRPVAAYCKGGYRSAIATSLLRRAGFREVVNLRGGFDAWSEAVHA
ncbi:MAG: MBL fold metallo-hydrolase [Candidatus Eremiobacteraeota bacterium]|nr:MBL fold metallo-hydrolase [Candidatus Eremiobacteraeota bacterium]